MIIPIEAQVTSLEISREMKKLRFRQDTFFRWVLWNGPDPQIWSEDHMELVKFEPSIGMDGRKAVPRVWKAGFAAYTVAELGTILPSIIDLKVGCLILDLLKATDLDDKEPWMISYDKYVGAKQMKSPIEISASTEANARGLMAIQLEKNGLLEKGNT